MRLLYIVRMPFVSLQIVVGAAHSEPAQCVYRCPKSSQLPSTCTCCCAPLRSPNILRNLSKRRNHFGVASCSGVFAHKPHGWTIHHHHRQTPRPTIRRPMDQPTLFNNLPKVPPRQYLAAIRPRLGGLANSFLKLMHQYRRNQALSQALPKSRPLGQ